MAKSHEQQEQDDILAREIGKLGGFLSGWIVRRLPNDEGEATQTITAPPVEVMSVLRALLGEQGEPQETPLPNQSFVVRAVVGSGSLNLNPTLVTVQVSPVAHDRSRVVVHGVAKEGLIKQHAGQKATEWVAQQLAAAFDQPD
jgi:hypothetical protein